MKTKKIKKQMPTICSLCRFLRDAPEDYYCEKLKVKVNKDMYKAKTCLFKENKNGE